MNLENFLVIPPESWSNRSLRCFVLFPVRSLPLSPSSSSFAGPPCAGAAGVLPERGELGDVRPHAGRRHLPHRARTILDAGADVGRQLSHGGAPPRGCPDLRFQQDPQFAQHEKSQPGRGTLSKTFEGRPKRKCFARRGCKCVNRDGIDFGLWLLKDCQDSSLNSLRGIILWQVNLGMGRCTHSLICCILIPALCCLSSIAGQHLLQRWPAVVWSCFSGSSAGRGAPGCRSGSVLHRILPGLHSPGGLHRFHPLLSRYGMTSANTDYTKHCRTKFRTLIAYC